MRVRLSTRERDALRSLPRQLLPVLTGEHELGAPGTPLRDRLFPSAYADDPLAEIEYRELVGSQVQELRVAALRTFARTLEGGVTRRLLWTVELDAEEATAWLSAVNDARLTLAMVAGITSEEQWGDGPDPDDSTSIMLYYLGWLEEQFVAALTGELDPRL
ncbi:MAG: DUF2017 family protein [Egibacteraceae bacterium]